MVNRRQHPSNKQGSKPRKKKAAVLSLPSLDLAKRILTEVGWEERIEGFFEAPMRGNLREFLFKFKDAANLLQVNVSDPWSTSSGIFGYFEFNELQAWIRDVFGDTELADAIGEILAADKSLKEQIESIKPLMELRISQCEEILEKKGFGKSA
jgi:hypothetical protein